MKTRSGIALASLVATCGLPVGAAHAQTPSNDYVAHEQTATDGANNEGSRPTSPGVGVSNLGVLATGTRYLSLFSKAYTITPLDERGVDDTDFPFVPASSSGTTLLDPRAYHDPIHNRLWGLYGEAVGDRKINNCAESSMLHLSVNKSGANFAISDPLDDSEWWYYTGSGGSAGNGGAAFDVLDDTSIQDYKNEAAHQPPMYTTRMPSMGFHTVTGDPNDRSGALIVATNALINCDSPGGDGPPPLFDALRQFIYIIPYEHDGGASSILDGDRPDESDMTVVRPFLNTPFPLTSDTSALGYVVQAPYEQVENATFIISVPETVYTLAGPFDKIRLKGLYYDDTQSAGSEWTLQQRTTSGGSPVLDDNTVGASFQYWPTNSAGGFPIDRPVTPDGSWGPLAQGTYFHSAVLAKDTEGEFKIFAVHAVYPVDDSGFWYEDQWVVQWYVFDPDLADFHSSTPGDWAPTLVAEGRLPVDIEEDEGDRYHPVVVVNRQGVAFIEYTYSDEADPMNDDTWPEVRRVRLNSSYTAIVGSETVVRSGPPIAYDEQYLLTWANVADAQADPVNQCAYWSTHTLVTDDSPSPTLKRDAWLFHRAYTNSVGPNCFQTTSMLDLNDDDEVDTYDMVAFGDLYAKGARRVDLSADGVVDETDAALYTAAYDAFTSK